MNKAASTPFIDELFLILMTYLLDVSFKIVEGT